MTKTEIKAGLRHAYTLVLMAVALSMLFTQAKYHHTMELLHEANRLDIETKRQLIRQIRAEQAAIDKALIRDAEIQEVSRSYWLESLEICASEETEQW